MGVFRLRSSISLSVLVHALFLFAWLFLFNQQATHIAPKKLTWIEVEPITRPLPKDDSKNQKQIVQSDKGKLTDKAAPDAFLGEHTQVVDIQSVSKNRTTKVGHETGARKEKQVAQAPTKPLALSKLGVAMLPPPGQKLQEMQDKDDSMVPGSHAQDYIKGFKESETTALNTKEYVFYGYFQRIRERLDLAWDRTLRAQLNRIYNQGRQLASEMDHTTKILVTMNGGGEIVKVQVIEQSGTRDLDDAAVKAFNEAGPFPNPPKGLVDNGQIKIRWDFVLRT